MANKIFLFVGIVIIGTGGIIKISGATVTVNNQAVSGDASNTIILVVSAGIALLGLFFFMVGLIGMIKNKKMNKQLALIAQTGVETEATVTFVDKNYSLLVNNRPIYSILEYKYKDMFGGEHVRQIQNMNSELVIRNKIEVGSIVKIKYLQTDPTQSVYLLTTS